MNGSPWRRAASLLELVLRRPRLAGAVAGAALLSLILLFSWLEWRKEQATIAVPQVATVSPEAPPDEGWDRKKLRRFKKRHNRPDLAPAPKATFPGGGYGTPNATGAPWKAELPNRPDPRPPWRPPFPGQPRQQATPISELTQPCPEGGTASAGLIREADGRVTQSLVVEGPRFFDWKARRQLYLEADVPDLRTELWRVEAGVLYRVVRTGHLGVSVKLAAENYQPEDPATVLLGAARLGRDTRALVGVRLTWE